MKLDDRIRELIAVGTAIGANCHPCLKHHTAKARDLGIPNNELAEAIEVGKGIRKGAQGSMDKLVNELLNETRATLAAVHSIRGIKAAIRTKGVSGTIKSAREKYLPRLVKLSYESDGRRIERKDISGCIIRTHGVKVDLCPDDRYKSAGSSAQFMGLTSLDLCGGHEDADGTADGL